MQGDSEPDFIKSYVSTPDHNLLHPLFSSPDADIILRAKGGELFRVHSYTLKTTSGWFRTMFSLPQKSTPAPLETIALDEDAHTLECLLRMICGLPILPMTEFALVDSVLYAAEKYDMPGPMSIIRILVMISPLVDDPFHIYTAACRYDWEQEAKLASTQTLVYNLRKPEMRPKLQSLGIDAVLNLFDLHHSRREGLRRRLNDPPFVSGHASNCISCGTLIDYHTWRELKYKIILEMDERPLGDTILDHGLENWPESLACWRAKCSNPTCDRVLYDKPETLRVIRECIEGLRKCI